jgi:hypothetical protein
MDVQHTVAFSKHCCCLDAGEYSLFRVSKFQALVADIIIIIILIIIIIIIIIIITDLFIRLDIICLFSSCIGAVFVAGH